MAQELSNMEQGAKTVTQLDTYTRTVSVADMYMVSVSVNELPPSAMSIVIQQNGSTKATSAAPTPAQEYINLQVVLNCASNDVISVILSSSADSDKAPNSFKALINIHQGSV